MEPTPSVEYQEEMLSFEGFRNTIMEDYKMAVVSREVSLLGRREVLTGKGKFGIFGDGKEVAQIAMAKFFQNGDFRSGYYRDQTFMFAAGLASVEQFFAQLYADPDVNNDPFSAGRQMDAHFSTPIVDRDGNWLDLVNRKNVSADMAPTASQMPRALGLAYASKCFRSAKNSGQFESLTSNGNEICFCTIGDASTSEGHFWETVNAAGVLQVPLAIFVWDDGYGISVPKNYQTTKGSISDALRGMEKSEHSNGIRIYKVKAWDYAGMCEVFEEALEMTRQTHVPVIFHVEEVTQPQGHSTSGSHERYKSPERLEWEKEWDCLRKMKEWMIENGLGDADELADIEATAKAFVRDSRNRAWENFQAPIRAIAADAAEMIRGIVINDMEVYNQLQKLANDLQVNKETLRRDIFRSLSIAMEAAHHSPSIPEVKEFYDKLLAENSCCLTATCTMKALKARCWWQR
jgi:TPP-dependent pyruvate/acetoin dehydrogenase alpha subunit